MVKFELNDFRSLSTPLAKKEKLKWSFSSTCVKVLPLSAFTSLEQRWIRNFQNFTRILEQRGFQIYHGASMKKDVTWRANVVLNSLMVEKSHQQITRTGNLHLVLSGFHSVLLTVRFQSGSCEINGARGRDLQKSNEQHGWKVIPSQVWGHTSYLIMGHRNPKFEVRRLRSFPLKT